MSEPTTEREQSGIPEGTAGDLLDRIEQSLVARRDLLLGFGMGSAGGVGYVLGTRRRENDQEFQSLATLAAGATLPFTTRYYLPCVDATGTGLILIASIEFVEGTGGTFVNLEHTEVRHDVQLSLREARRATSRLTGSSFSRTDVYVTFTLLDRTRDLLEIRGKSWEAGLIVAMIAGLRQHRLSRDILITGNVNDDGTLLPVGAVDTKARAARSFGASTLLVPPGQDSVEVPGIRISGVPTISAAIAEIVG